MHVKAFLFEQEIMLLKNKLFLLLKLKKATAINFPTATTYIQQAYQKSD